MLRRLVRRLTQKKTTPTTPKPYTSQKSCKQNMSEKPIKYVPKNQKRILVSDPKSGKIIPIIVMEDTTLNIDFYGMLESNGEIVSIDRKKVNIYDTEGYAIKG